MKLGDMRGFVEAVNGACTCGGNGPGEGCPACEVYHAVRDWEVAGPVVQPLPPAPELAEAEKWLLKVGEGLHGDSEGARADTIAAEVRRLRLAEQTLRAEVSWLTGEAQREMWVDARNAEVAVDEAASDGGWESEKYASRYIEEGENVYHVTLTARRVP